MRPLPHTSSLNHPNTCFIRQRDAFSEEDETGAVFFLFWHNFSPGLLCYQMFADSILQLCQICVLVFMKYLTWSLFCSAGTKS